MAFSLNKVMLIGNLGGDAENRMTVNDVPVTSFSLATTHSYKGKDGNWVNDTTWHNVVAFNLSDYMRDKLKKGKKFYVEGRLNKRSYENKQGQTVYITEIIAEKLIPLDAAGQSEGFKASEPKAEYSNVPPDTADAGEDLPF